MTDSAATPRPDAPGGRGRRLGREALELLATVAVALVVAVLVKTFLVQAFSIPSPSMENTLLVQDRVLVSKLEPGPLTMERGDLVVFVDPNEWLSTPVADPNLLQRAGTFVGLLPADSGTHLIKRVVGMPGDTVACCDAEGRVLVNGVPIDEPYLFPGEQPSLTEFDVEVPPDRLWVMGDHRSVSNDSRALQADFGDGFVPLENVVGRAVLRIWPVDRWATLPTPEGVFDDVGGVVGID
ncbi:signal peptidase I [Aquipuribacter sp. MA13-6]|uniref:signal peptidase I n=1 Tax=unclassified Aquipuribacter TaxID=2635084 RepID=UPI003EEBCFD7